MQGTKRLDIILNAHSTWEDVSRQFINRMAHSYEFARSNPMVNGVSPCQNKQHASVTLSEHIYFDKNAQKWMLAAENEIMQASLDHAIATISRHATIQQPEALTY